MCLRTTCLGEVLTRVPVLYLRGMIEKVRRGSLLVLNACRHRDLPAPVWSTDALGVTLTFHAPQVTGEVAGEDAGQVTGQVAGQDSTDNPASTQQVPSKQPASDNRGMLPTGDQLGTTGVPSLSQVCPKSVPSDVAAALLRAAASGADLKALMEAAGQTNRTRFRNGMVKPLIDAGLVGPTIPDKPRSSKQKYRLTDKGKKWLKEGRGAGRC